MRTGAPDYASEQPLHPEWNFTGREQMLKNWSGIFAEVPDLKAELIRSTWAGDEVWTEWGRVGVSDRPRLTPWIGLESRTNSNTDSRNRIAL